MKKVLLLAGEESGVLYARSLTAKLKALYPGVEIRGYSDYGFETGDLAVFGIWAVLRKFRYFLRVKQTLQRAIDEWRPDAVCTIDYPGLNLRLAAYAKARGIRAVHVVCPQVWAWHQNRIPRIEAALDRLCCFFPFEPALFRPGFAEFIGHPLVDQVRREREGDGRSAKTPGKLLAVLPGSRLGEIGYHLPVLLKAVAALQREIAGLQVVIPAANPKARAAIERQLAKAPAAVRSAIRLQSGGARQLLAAADAAVVASGTATLEAALMNCPTVLVYRVSRLLAALLRHIITGTRYAGLANVVWERCGGAGTSPRPPMPELLQEQFTVENLLGYLKPYLTDERRAAAARSELAAAMQLLHIEGDSLAKIVSFLV